MNDRRWLHEMAIDMLPEDGYVTAKELSETPDGVQPMTELLDILVEAGAAVAILTEVGDQKEWAYGRLNARPI